MAKVLILGSGGREHALAWWFRNYGHSVDAAPGNAGTAKTGNNIGLQIDDFPKVATLALHEGYDLVVPGAEAQLCKGIADFWEENNLRDSGVRMFGPKRYRSDRTCGGAMLEGSKIFAREFAKRHGIPIPDYVGFRSSHKETNHNQARSHWKHRENTGKKKLMVVKADGLCGGKGVFVCDNDDEVFRAISSMPKFGDEGVDFVLEERLTGPEASIHVITDGKSYRILPSSTDHKRRYSDAEFREMQSEYPNPNTGGMGAFAPAAIITPELEQRIEESIIRPTISGMAEEDFDYRGVLYFATMIHKGDPYLIEYNVRFGDPETQAIIPLVDADPFDLMVACSEGKLDDVSFRLKDDYSCCVVLCEERYPKGKPERPVSVSFGTELNFMQDIHIFHAGTKSERGLITSSGGRVLGVTAVSGQSIGAARRRAYDACKYVKFKGKAYRDDIALSVMEGGK